MQAALRHLSQEHQQVYRQFAIRWMQGCMYTRVYDAADDALTRGQIDTWARALGEVVPRVGGPFVSIIDTRDIGEIPRSLWVGLVKLSAAMPRLPERRALLAAEGWLGDTQAQAVSLVTAGKVRVFRPSQFDEMVAWLADAHTLATWEIEQFIR